MAESEPADAEIAALLRHLQGTEHEQAAWAALQLYRSEALAGARAGIDPEAKAELVRQARERLRGALLHLLGHDGRHVAAPGRGRQSEPGRFE